MKMNQARIRAAHLGPDRRRPQVLDTALLIAVDQGLAAVTMESVAKSLEVTRPVVYSCYASREEMIGALLEREEQRLYQGVIGALPEAPRIGAGQQMLTAGFQALLGGVAAHAMSWRFLLAADSDHGVVERYGRARARVAEQVRALMEPMLKGVGVEQLERKLPVLIEVFMALGDAAVRAMLQSEQHWSPDELGAYVARITLAAFSKA